MKKYKPLIIGVAGSTQHTVMCAESLRGRFKEFEIAWILTPEPRLIGRKQELVTNPIHQFAQKHSIPVILVDKKIDRSVKETVEDTNRTQPIDILLVVDFGYLIPQWLLDLPKISPVNVHPSDLPKYRGSSPGQFTLLYGEKKSAVSVIVMNDKLDEGDIIYQAEFDVLSTFFTQSFYEYAFQLIAEKLPNILAEFAYGQITPVAQPLTSPTPIARRLSREDGFVKWEFLHSVILNSLQDLEEKLGKTSPLLVEVNEKLQSWPQTISNAVRALTPWPGVWTLVQTNKGEKRMKILETSLENGKLKLEKVQIEGYSPASFGSVKNLIL